MIPSLTLPEGRAGQLTAAGLTLAALAVLWLLIAAPIIGWYQSGAADLAQAQAIAARLAALDRQIPALRQAAAKTGLDGAQLLLPGNSDAVAGAGLQSALQTLAANAGASLDSAQLLPAQQTGALRGIGMQVSVTADYGSLIALLQAIGAARPRMIVNSLSLDNTANTAGGDPSIEADFTVIGFRARP